MINKNFSSKNIRFYDFYNVKKKLFIALIFSWMAFVVVFLNALYFVIRTANPIIRSDSWYFLQVFISKALNGTLGISDFFVKRSGVDHAQPMFKIVLWLELRFFDLDFSIEALVGVIGAAACALILHQIVIANKADARTNIRSYATLTTIYATLFSLNSTETWTWPLVTIEYLTYIPMLLFIWAAWLAMQTRYYVILAVATLFLDIADDDSALIAIMATVLAMTLLVVREWKERRHNFLMALGVIAVCTIAVRVGYAYAPVTGLTKAPKTSFSGHLNLLAHRLQNGEGWQWVTKPLELSVLSAQTFSSISRNTRACINTLIAVILLIMHGRFWWRASRSRLNLPAFTAVCLMILFYGWLIGIILFRVSLYGADYLDQGRYVRFYQFNLIALLLMWCNAAKVHEGAQRWQKLRNIFPALACASLLALQLPVSYEAWFSRRYIIPYYQRMAVQIAQLAKNPEQTNGCLPELTVCMEPLMDRQQSLRLLSTYQLNVFSRNVQKRHSFLPYWRKSELPFNNTITP